MNSSLEIPTKRFAYLGYFCKYSRVGAIRELPLLVDRLSIQFIFLRRSYQKDSEKVDGSDDRLGYFFLFRDPL
jgi:hypothetical protein